MPLTELAVRKAKATEKAYKLTDSGGLFLYVMPAGGKSWRWKYYVDGREKLMTLGLYPDVSLAEARERRDQARKMKSAGHDPMAERKLEQQLRRIAAENAFEAVAKAWLAQWSPDKSPRHVEYVQRRLESDVFPAIGSRPVSEIQAPELVAMVKKISARGAGDIAKRAYQTCSQVEVEVEVPPISRTLFHSRRSPRCPPPSRPIRRRFVNRWSSWFAQDAASAT